MVTCLLSVSIGLLSLAYGIVNLLKLGTERAPSLSHFLIRPAERKRESCKKRRIIKLLFSFTVIQTLQFNYRWSNTDFRRVVCLNACTNILHVSSRSEEKQNRVKEFHITYQILRINIPTWKFDLVWVRVVMSVFISPSKARKYIQTLFNHYTHRFLVHRLSSGQGNPLLFWGKSNIIFILDSPCRKMFIILLNDIQYGTPLETGKQIGVAIT